MQVKRMIKTSSLLTLTLILVLSALPVSAARTQAQKNLDDQDITDAVETELLLDEGVASHRVDVSTREGVVLLAGTVENLLAKERAVKLAESVKGVRSVVNQIVVEPHFGLTDTEIRRDVNDALLSDPATESFDIGVGVEDGVVTLSGTVESWTEQELALEVAKRVRGVKDVKDKLYISYKPDRPDQEIKNDIERRLESDVWVDDGLIDVAVQDGKVTLSGTVGSAAEKRQAKLDARVAGMKSVDAEELNVKWWARDEMRREERYKNVSDAELEKAVKDAFFYDPRIRSVDFEVEAKNGVVTLRGDVNSFQAKRAAEASAENTIGVWRVKNRIRVRPSPVRADEAVAADVRSALARDPYLDRYDIDVSVVNGRVFLNGSVRSEFDKEQAAEVAARVRGVIDVANNLSTSSTQPELSDWEIKEDIEDELFWSPFVDSEDITVTVENGVATLTGTVDTWFEFQKARENALEGGARHVDNNLRFRYGPDDFGSDD